MTVNIGTAVSAAVTSQRAGGLDGSGFIAISDRQWASFGSASNGTDTGGNFRIRHIATASAQELRVSFNNFAGANAITVRAGLEVNGILVPVYFAGQRDVVIQPDGYVISDPVGVQVTKGSTFYSRSRVTVTSGQTWKITVGASETGEAVETGTATTDKTTSGTITVGGSTLGYGPWAILYRPNVRVPSVTFLGDSHIDGGRNPQTYWWRTLVQGALSAHQVGVGGDKLTNWTADGVVGATTPAVGFQLVRRALLGAGNHVVCELGINDFTASRTAAQVQADWTTIWKACAALGVKVWQTTITPRSTSTDSFATTGNQTTDASNAARTASNDWLRAGAPMDPNTILPVAVGTTGAILAGSANHPLAGYLEVADSVESARNSGLWKVNGSANTWTSDGLHPSDLGMTTIGGALSAATFT